jgi:D-beta-D-heptose 7-phosphate kinase/D-beta-D-heptose 1-phosphate adenosyltransferase
MKNNHQPSTLNHQPNILVVGDLMIDHYLWGKCERISPEAPVQVVDIQKETTVLGGAGNVINNLVTLGAKVCVLSVIGKDETANELVQMLQKVNATHCLVEQQGRKTSKKSRIMASRAQVVRYDNESKEDISATSQEKLIEYFKTHVCAFDTILFSDYGKGVLTSKVCQTLIKIANENNKKVLVDPKGKDYSKYKGAYFLTPNKKEAQEATSIEITDQSSLKKALQTLKQLASLQISMITLSEDGIAILQDDEVITKPTVAREVYDVTGAGDTVLASLGYALALGHELQWCVEFANLAAGVVVGKIGSATVSLDEIEEYKSSLHKSSIELHIKTKEELLPIVRRLKKQNRRIVFTNGCFDILHRGHVSYLDVAKSFGDILILGLNSDRSVKRLKGESRPINCQEDRAYILSALECVDYVVIFDEQTPYELIKAIEPDVLVKGADYEGKEVVGSDIAKQTKLVEFVQGKSTTTTIEKIKEAK